MRTGSKELLDWSLIVRGLDHPPESINIPSGYDLVWDSPLSELSCLDGTHLSGDPETLKMFYSASLCHLSRRNGFWPLVAGSKEDLDTACSRPTPPTAREVDRPIVAYRRDHP